MILCDSDYSFFPNFVRSLSIVFPINPKFPVIANFKRSIGEFFCCEKTNEDISAKQVCKTKCSIEVTNLGTYHGGVLPIVLSFNGGSPSNNTTPN